MTSSRAWGLGLLATLLVAGCGSDDGGPSGPVPGPLNVVLTSPNGDDGAVMFQVTGVVDSVVAPAGITLYQSIPGPNVLRVIATGSAITSGSSLLTMYVPDVAKTSSYSVQLMQVAAKATYAQRAVGGYGLKVQK